MHPSLRALAQHQGGVFTHLQAMQAGYPHEEVRRQVAAGRWVRVRHGVMAEPATVDAAAAGGHAASALFQLSAVLLRVGPGVVASHESSGLVHDVPVYRIPTRRHAHLGSITPTSGQGLLRLAGRAPR